MGRQEFVSILEPEDLPEDEVAQANGQIWQVQRSLLPEKVLL